MPQAILRLPQVLARTGLSRSMIYLLQSELKFPRSISISERAIGWLEEDVSAWIETRVKESRLKHRAAAGRAPVQMAV
jgi:prophage regulatory protein